jgi:hypothetical protein
MLILLSDRFHKSIDWILRGDGNQSDAVRQASTM